MKTYLVRIEAEIPYPWAQAYRVEATGYPAAVARGVRDFRKEERVKGKRINKLKIEVTVLH